MAGPDDPVRPEGDASENPLREPGPADHAASQPAGPARREDGETVASNVPSSHPAGNTPPEKPAPEIAGTDPSTPTGGSPTAGQSTIRGLGKFLWTQNPFYLISVALVMHSTRLWHHDAVDGFNPWPLMSIICSYMLVVAITGFLLVKLGKVWDDARSILLSIELLFVELSLMFDGILLNDPATGRNLILTGWCTSIAVSEFLLQGLRMRLPALFRIPYYLILSLMFLYPLFITSSAFSIPVTWRIFAFAPLMAVVLLCLIPAVRKGHQFCQPNGTPWRWPLYPWSLFIFLVVCLCLRAWSLTLSFDPVLDQSLNDAMRMDGIFGIYFLIPLLFAIAVLLFETGRTEKSEELEIFALWLPPVCIPLATSYIEGSAPYFEFRQRFTEVLGAPAWIAWELSWLYYAYAIWRGRREALIGLTLSAFALLLFGRLWPEFSRHWGFPSLPLLLTTAYVLNWGWQRRDSRLVVGGLLGLYLTARDLALQSGHSWMTEAVLWNLVTLAVLVTGLMFKDAAARFWQHVGIVLVGANCLAAAVLPDLLQLSVPFPVPVAYCAAMTILAAGYAMLTRLRICRKTAYLTCFIMISRVFFDTADVLKRTYQWDGAHYFLFGLETFLIAVMISVVKSVRAQRASVNSMNSDNQQTP